MNTRVANLLPILFVIFLSADLPDREPGDKAPQAVLERAERTVEKSQRNGQSPLAGGPGNLLFQFNGDDNAECVRSIPDVTGDGLDEIIVAYGWWQDNENLYCLDGSSSGTAQVVWKLETLDGVSGGYFYGDQCLAPASDTDSNGWPNFLAGTAGGGRTAYNMDGLAGTAIWKLDLYTTPADGWIYCLVELNDLNGDGIPDAVFGAGSDSDSVYCVDGASSSSPATLLWQYHAVDAVYSVRDMGDVNADGAHDVLAAIGDNVDKIVCLDGGTNPLGSVLWTYSPGSGVYSCGVLPDITGDGVNEALAVIWTSDGSAVRCLNGASGVWIWSSSDVGSYGQQVQNLEDVTKDGYAEVIVSSWENAVTVISGVDGSLVWKRIVGTLNGGDVWTARAIDDLNGDGREDVIAGSFDYYVYALDGDSGETFWAYYTGNRVFSVYPVGDLNNDGRPEVAVGTQDTGNNNVVRVLEGDADIPWPGLTLTGTFALGSDLEIEITGNPGWFVLPGASLSTGSTPWPPFGTLELGQPVHQLQAGAIPPLGQGPYVFTETIPNNPSLSGRTIYFQGLVYRVGPLEGAFTDLEEIVVL